MLVNIQPYVSASYNNKNEGKRAGGADALYSPARRKKKFILCVCGVDTSNPVLECAF